LRGRGKSKRKKVLEKKKGTSSTIGALMSFLCTTAKMGSKKNTKITHHGPKKKNQPCKNRSKTMEMGDGGTRPITVSHRFLEKISILPKKKRSKGSPRNKSRRQSISTKKKAGAYLNSTQIRPNP